MQGRAMTPSPIHSRRVALAAAGVFMLYGRSAEREIDAPSVPLPPRLRFR